MKKFEKQLKRGALKKSIEIRDVLNSFIQPFKEMPSTNKVGEENTGRISAHDLFSFYTADIIKEDVIFSR